MVIVTVRVILTAKDIVTAKDIAITKDITKDIVKDITKDIAKDIVIVIESIMDIDLTTIDSKVTKTAKLESDYESINFTVTIRY